MQGHMRQRSPNSWELKNDLGHDPITGRRLYEDLGELFALKEMRDREQKK